MAARVPCAGSIIRAHRNAVTRPVSRARASRSAAANAVDVGGVRVGAPPRPDVNLAELPLRAFERVVAYKSGAPP